ncbi:hypothetical protein BZA77DRAFT_344959 [Pyronema omphalodes]|nr:hypothetical protein BZA77DRAFT_344959 [Pyronema omphalodes]
MPLNVLATAYYNGIAAVPVLPLAIKYGPWLLLLAVLKLYFRGSQNRNERVMHSKVALVTGGTSGIGRAIVEDLATRGCQIILLVKDHTDLFTCDFIDDLRERTQNQFIYAETCDLSSLHSVRKFATKFIDNSPPRRLDLVVCAAGIMAPPFGKRETTKDGVELHVGVNYFAHFLLLSLLEPLLKAQPADRDVRVLLATCAAHIIGELDMEDLQFLRRGYPSRAPWKCYGASKTALMAFGCELQRRLAGYERKDGEKVNCRVYNVDPGLARTPGARRWLSLGSLWGLLVYLIMWPFWWLVLKSPQSAAQTFLAAAMSKEYEENKGGVMLKECKVISYRDPRITSPEFGKELWTVTETLLKDIEKESAIKRKQAEKLAAANLSASDKAAAAKAAAEEKAEREQDAELKAKLRAKAQEQEKKKRMLDELIAEEEKRRGVLDLPPRVTVREKREMERREREESMKEGRASRLVEVKEEVEQVPDSPARNTRSRSKTPAMALGETPGTPTRRRASKKT